MNPKSPPPEHCTPAFVEAFNRSVPSNEKVNMLAFVRGWRDGAGVRPMATQEKHYEAGYSTGFKARIAADADAMRLYGIDAETIMLRTQE